MKCLGEKRNRKISSRRNEEVTSMSWCHHWLATGWSYCGNRNNCHRHDINFHIYLIFVPKSFNLPLIYELLRVWNCRAIFFFVRLFVCLSIVSGYQKSRSALKSNKNKGNLAGFMRKFLSPNQKFILLTCKKVHELCFEIFSAHRKYCIRLWNCERGCLGKSGCANGIFHFTYFIYAILFASVLSNIA